MSCAVGLNRFNFRGVRNIPTGRSLANLTSDITVTQERSVIILDIFVESWFQGREGKKVPFEIMNLNWRAHAFTAYVM